MKEHLKYYWSGFIAGMALMTIIVTFIAVEVQVPVMSTDECVDQQTPLVNRIDELYTENAKLTKKLTHYEADEAYIKALPGADEDVVQKIIKASGALNVDPK